MKIKKIIVSFALLSLSFSSIAGAHPGRTDANGGHYCRTNCEKWGLKYGEYHYHNGGGSSSGSSSSGSSSTGSSSPVYTTPKEVIPDGAVKVSLPSYPVYVNGQQVIPHRNIR